jgi:hypothetical protein
VAVLDQQKNILHAAKHEAKEAKLRARQLRTLTLPKCTGRPAEELSGTEDEGDGSVGAQFHQGIDAEGVVRDLAACLEGAPSIVRKRLPLVFPIQGLESNSNVRLFISKVILSSCPHIICTCHVSDSCLLFVSS